MKVKNIAIFASGRGSNAQKIIDYFEHRKNIRVRLIISNKAKAGVIELAEARGIEFLIIQRESFYETETLIENLREADIDLIVLAGFLWLIPKYLIRDFNKRIINIHPALLPKYGGKGMYGHHVHEAVFQHKDKVSGITIHLVNEYYDEGKHLFQVSCPLELTDKPEDIAAKVLALEHLYFPQVVDQYLDTLDKKWIKV